MRVSPKIILLAVALVFSTVSVAEECEAVVATAPIEKVTDYLQHVGDGPAVAACVQVAFRRIGSLPKEQAIPILITYLGDKRPLYESERHGFFMHGKSPDELYPAVQQLYLLGSAAEAPMIGFIRKNKDNKGEEVKNALYTLLLIHHGDVLPVVQELHGSSKTSTSSEARDRLQNAAIDAAKWCDERARSECEDALK